ncbi:transcriptional regulator, XRE family (plasmid) [Allochromatium vinosum DSM 180]|uniref:Transcriptional regulator, XRE family n=2 Tax=Allochromatium vinosum TaxID=1049 RepID=D3RW84_ALLVD|nr:helix-turn-helix transcriptional regulator [Allochromatium vinosum]ADC64096.1 transcriptional regulator, XRE family [Allochromatium vinosum DSM 180]
MLHARLKSARIARDLSQAQVATALDLSQGFVSKLESGDKTPSVELLQKLAKLYEVTESHLLGSTIEGSGDESSGSKTPAEIIALLLDPNLPSGLRALAEDPTINALKITLQEWRMLCSIALPREIDKAGYIQILLAIRGVLGS